MLIQLIYMSAATQAFTSSDLAALLTNARLKNKLLGITGMLLYHEVTFLQILEGEARKVDELYRCIGRDGRHHHCEVLVRSCIDRRSFEHWEMGFVNTNHFRDTSIMAGYQDLLKLRNDSPTTGIAHKLLVSFRDGVLKQAATQPQAHIAER